MRFTVFFIAFLALVMLVTGKPNERKPPKKGRSGDQAAGAPKANGQGAAQTPAGNGWGTMGGGQPFMGGWQFSSFPNMGRPNGGNPSGFSGFWG